VGRNGKCFLVGTMLSLCSFCVVLSLCSFWVRFVLSDQRCHEGFI
jgi:hypothetical protein